MPSARLLLLLALGATGANAFFQCPQNTVNVTNFPFSWPYDTTVPQPYDMAVNCSIWQFTIPNETYATITVNARFAQDDYFTIESSNGFRQTYEGTWPSSIPQNVSNVYFFPADIITRIILQVNSNSSAQGFLSFRIDLHDVPNLPVHEEDVTNATATILPLSTFSVTEYRLKQVIDGPKLMLSLVGSDPADPRADSCFLYEGPSCKDGVFVLGAAFLIHDFTFHSEDVAICCFTSNLPDYYLIMTAQPDFMQDGDKWISRFSENQTQKFDEITERWDTEEAQYLTTYCPEGCAEYLEQADRIVSTKTAPLENISSFGIFAGFPSAAKWQILSEVPLKEMSSWLSQEVRGVVRTYVARRGDVNIGISKDPSKWSEVTTTRQGFFMSQNYPFLSDDQTTSSTIYSTNNSQFYISGASASMGYGGSATLSTDEGQELSLSFSGSRTLEGSQITFNTIQGNSSSTGALVFFTIIPEIRIQGAVFHNVTDLPYSWPFDTLIPQPYTTSQMWQFQIPKQTYATIIVNARFGDNDTFVIKNSMGYELSFGGYFRAFNNYIPQKVSNTFFFPADDLTTIRLDMKSSDPGYLSIRIDIHDVPEGSFSQESVDCLTASIIPLSSAMMSEYRFKHATNGSKLMLSLATDGAYDLRADSCLIYEGPSCKDGNFLIGAGFLSSEFIVSSKDVAICCFTTNIPKAYLIAAAQPDFMEPGDRWISFISSARSVNLDALSRGTDNSSVQYVTTVCPEGCAEYLEAANTISTGTANVTLGIYAGFPSQTRFSVLYESSVDEILKSHRLPQEVRGTARTYVARNGDVSIGISKDSGKWSNGAIGRNGFFMSANYPFLSDNQSASSTINSNKYSAFYLTDGVNNMGNGSVTLSTDKGTMKDFPEFVANIYGNTISFSAVQGDDSSCNGAITYFSIANGSTASSSALAAVLIIIAKLFV